MAKLYVVATPIGNLNDLTPRAAEAFAQADLIAAEDTRVTMKLLAHLNLSKPMVSCHRHNEENRADWLIRRMLEEDLTVALACDAGTPAISDPGNQVVEAAWEAGIEVVPVSGASATVTALSACGFDAREFAFYGFLPREKKALRDKLVAIRKSGIPVGVAYESPHRVLELVEQFCEVLPESRLCVCCDLTKRYEKMYRGECREVLSALSANPNVEKGEYCVVFDLSRLSPLPEERPRMPAEARLLMGLLEEKELDEAADEALGEGYSRNEVYRARLKIKEMFE
ncbi:MAG: 16S rRNA (cytidine(1402)-2'-O)-methyltransferase [Eubacteriales bacterium]|nr:16S rRNA (cytidine(1402)-2'-O)-methyltransferase [Eubacteriales bacterium]